MLNKYAAAQKSYFYALKHTLRLTAGPTPYSELLFTQRSALRSADRGVAACRPTALVKLVLGLGSRSKWQAFLSACERVREPTERTSACALVGPGAGAAASAASATQAARVRQISFMVALRSHQGSSSTAGNPGQPHGSLFHSPASSTRSTSLQQLSGRFRACSLQQPGTKAVISRDSQAILTTLVRQAPPQE